MDFRRVEHLRGAGTPAGGVVAPNTIEGSIDGTHKRRGVGQGATTPPVKDGRATIGGNSTDRMVIAVNSPEVMQANISIMPYVTQIRRLSWSYCAPMEFKMSPMMVLLPFCIGYWDGI